MFARPEALLHPAHMGEETAVLVMVNSRPVSIMSFRISSNSVRAIHSVIRSRPPIPARAIMGVNGRQRAILVATSVQFSMTVDNPSFVFIILASQSLKLRCVLGSGVAFSAAIEPALAIAFSSWFEVTQFKWTLD